MESLTRAGWYSYKGSCRSRMRRGARGSGRRTGADQRLPGHLKENKLQKDPQGDGGILPKSQAREIQYRLLLSVDPLANAILMRSSMLGSVLLDSWVRLS